MSKEKNDDFYNEVYKNGGHNEMYFKEAEDIGAYYPTWKYAYDYIKSKRIDKVIDFGCGVGHFASLFSQDDEVLYFGYDFSSEAIRQATKRNESNLFCQFYTANLKKNFEVQKESNTIYTAFEFFEHISFDLDIIGNLNHGDEILFSVPNYDSAGHVRFFDDFESITERYGSLMDVTLVHELNTAKNRKIFLCKGFKK